MSKDIHFKPFQREHKHLDDIAENRKHIKVDMAEIADYVEDSTDEEIAEEVYEAELASQGFFKNYVFVEEPRKVDGMWIIHLTLSDLGRVAHSALKAGILWHIADGVPDYEATKDYYRKMIASGRIELRYVELLLETKTDELKDLRSELVYFKLQGQNSGGAIVRLVNAA